MYSRLSILEVKKTKIYVLWNGYFGTHFKIYKSIMEYLFCNSTCKFGMCYGIPIPKVKQSEVLNYEIVVP